MDIGDYVFFGHDVMLLTGTHDFRETGAARHVPTQTLARNIVIEEGAWIATRAVIIGPCTIGRNAVVGKAGCRKSCHRCGGDRLIPAGDCLG